MTAGNVRDIRTGRAIGKTSSLTQTFVDHIQALMEQDMQFYLVHGRVRHLDVRVMLNDLREALTAVEIIYDARMPSDTVWIFEGDPEELGFAV